MSFSVPQVHFEGNATNDGRVQLPFFGRIEMRMGLVFGAQWVWCDRIVQPRP